MRHASGGAGVKRKAPPAPGSFRTIADELGDRLKAAARLGNRQEIDAAHAACISAGMLPDRLKRLMEGT